MQKLLVTMKDIQRYKVLKDVIEKKLKGIEATQILNLTPALSALTGILWRFGRPSFG